ncbi:ribonuclease H protein, partial [Trifolium medium]|nr:ribonuclease H protein [Trifolium medium]
SNEQWARLCRSRFLRFNYPIGHYVKSSIWAGIKHYTETILDNSIWLIGDGARICYWTDNWLGVTLVDALDISIALRPSLVAKVSNTIHEGTWTIPPLVEQYGPWLVDEILIITLPLTSTADCFVWKHSKNGILTSREAYEHLNSSGPALTWASTIWQNFIPPSHSFVAWRLMLRKMPTDENLCARGCVIVSMCPLCKRDNDSSEHLFFQCSFAMAIWNWVNSIFEIQVDHSFWKGFFLVAIHSLLF